MDVITKLSWRKPGIIIKMVIFSKHTDHYVSLSYAQYHPYPKDTLIVKPHKYCHFQKAQLRRPGVGSGHLSFYKHR